MKRRLLLFFLLVSSLLTAQNNIYRSGGITQTVGAPTFVPGASGNIVAIDTVTGEWYVNPNRLSGSSWISAGYRLTNISGSVPPAYTPTAHQSHFVVNAANELYYWDGSAWQSVGGGGSGDATRLKFLVVNKSGGTLNKGDVVYVSGAQGNRVAVKKALATSDSLSATTLGVMDATVANNNEGYCVAEGLVTGLNTSAFTEGAALYLSPTTAGAITQTKPTAPNHLVLIGYCVKSNNGSGEISVHIDNGYELGELHDVYIPAPTNGQVLTYDATDSRWEAATVADQSATNEIQTIDTFSLSGQTLRASLSSDAQPAKTVTLPVVNVTAGTGISVSSATGNYTVTNSAPDQTVSITNGGGITPSGTYPNFTLTAADQSATNEIQRLDTFSISGQTLSASLLNDGVAASSVTLPIVDVVAGTNVTVNKSNGVATVSATGGGGGTPAGSAGQVQFNSTPAGSFAASANLAWDNTATQLNIGAPSAPTGKLNVKGGGATTTVGLSITNNSNTSIIQSLDNGNVGFGQSSPLATVHIKAASNTSGAGIILESPEATLTGDRGLSMYVTGNGQTTAGANNSNFSFIVGGPGTSSVSQGPFFQLFGNNYSRFSGYRGAMYFYAGQVTSPSAGDGIISFVSTSSYIDFSTGSTSTLSRLRILNSGNIIMQNGGSFTDGGYKLDIISASSTHALRVRAPNANSGTNALLVQNTTVSDLYKIEANGKISYWATNTAAGTTGPQTIDKPSGTVNFGIGASSLVVTNSLCTTASIVFATVRTNDATAYIKNVVPGAGSFTINLGAAATAETSVGFFIIN